LYFRIGEVAGLLAVEPYVLRYWETEFPSLAPKKSGTGHRLYRRKDVELLLKIKHLLYDKRYTIEGARQSLHNDSKGSKPKVLDHKQGDLFTPDPLAGIRTELASILEILK
jgi:DNA-binding transcriptional MerR regulator